MNNHKRVFYFCSINSRQYEQVLNQQLHIGAATNKVLSVISALRSNDCKAYAVSLPVLGGGSKIKSVKKILLKEKGNPIIYMPVVSNPILRRLLGIVYFAGFCLFTVKNQDRVLVYNGSPEYILALLVLKLKGNPAIVDVEDAPYNEGGGFRYIMDKITFKITVALCRKKYITVSAQVARNLKLQSFYVVYGAVNKKITLNLNNKNEENVIRILYGGSLCDDTGLTLFCDTFRLLCNRSSQNNVRIVFVVTGFGGVDRLRELESETESKNVRIELRSNLPFTEYQTIFNTCHAGLCLKMPDSAMGSTTFPSKVVEITTGGLLLISTKASDIPILFSNSDALLLDEATPEKLCAAINWVANNPDEWKACAIRGQARAMELFAEDNVGKNIKDLIFQ